MLMRAGYFLKLNAIDVVGDHGTVQNAVGQLLRGSFCGDSYWVNAQRSGSFYQYQGDSGRSTFHTTTQRSGDCLTYSSHSGTLNTAVRREILWSVDQLVPRRARIVQLSGNLCATGGARDSYLMFQSRIIK